MLENSEYWCPSWSTFSSFELVHRWNLCPVFTLKLFEIRASSLVGATVIIPIY